MNSFALNTSYNEFITKPKTTNPLLKALNDGWKTALFMESLRNLNWSKDYLWYCELDGVPSPFQRGGVLGLPAVNLGFTYTSAHSFEFSSAMVKMGVPKGDVDYETINMTILDDEQGTIRQFFERWYNQIYNPYTGVLPVTEACKCLTIYFQKTTRRNIRRVYYDIDKSIQKQVMSEIFKAGGSLNRPNETEGIDFYVFPEQSFRADLHTTGNGAPFQFTITLRVHQIANADFGNPCINEGVTDLWGKQLGGLKQGNSWLDKLADYI